MHEYVLETHDLTMEFRNYKALNKINLKLKRGHIYGFVGNNGAGKTTFMRLISGLLQPTAGSFSLFGAHNDKENRLNRKRTGIIVEEPVYYSDMTARQNLIAQSIIQGKIDRQHIKELLCLVGIDKTGGKPLRNYSTGMKQRYGLAFALLGNPELLLLDEPLNGLDVDGMDIISDVLMDLNREKDITMLISSHLLARLNQIATDYIFIHLGKIIEVITAEELNEKLDENNIEKYFRELIRTNAIAEGGRKDG